MTIHDFIPHLPMRERIKQLMTDQHLNQQSFAERLGISPASLSSIFNERTDPTLKHVDAIRKAFPQINLEWLLYGRGSMFLESPASPSSPTGGLATDDSNGLLLDFAPDTPSSPVEPPVLRYPQKGQNLPLSPDTVIMKNIDKLQRKITEIRIFYDDQTWETFLPKK